jgi:hypothetical protein
VLLTKSVSILTQAMLGNKHETHDGITPIARQEVMLTIDFFVITFYMQFVPSHSTYFVKHVQCHVEECSVVLFCK